MYFLRRFRGWVTQQIRRLNRRAAHTSKQPTSRPMPILTYQSAPDFLSLLEQAEHRDRNIAQHRDQLRSGQTSRRSSGSRTLRRGSSLLSSASSLFSLKRTHHAPSPAAAARRSSRAGARAPFAPAVRSRQVAQSARPQARPLAHSIQPAHPSRPVRYSSTSWAGASRHAAGSRYGSPRRSPQGSIPASPRGVQPTARPVKHSSAVWDGGSRHHRGSRWSMCVPGH